MSGMLPKISLVTCSYQQARFLDAAIRSVLAQAYPALEYLVVDGGSQDGSERIIRRHAKQLSWWVSEPDGGQTDALVKGFTRASGDIFGWLCSDDLLLPGALDAVGRLFRDHPQLDAVYGDAIWIDANGKAIRPKREMGFSRFVFLHDFNYVPQPSMFWRRSLYERVGGLQRGFDLAMDTDLWERFSATSSITHLPRYLSCMRYYPQQKTRDGKLHHRKLAEDGLIAGRSTALAQSRAFGSAGPYLLRATARVLRMLHKAAAGGYTRTVPAELHSWLASYATPEDYNFSTRTGFIPADRTCPPETVAELPSMLRSRL